MGDLDSSSTACGVKSPHGVAGRPLATSARTLASPASKIASVVPGDIKPQAPTSRRTVGSVAERPDRALAEQEFVGQNTRTVPERAVRHDLCEPRTDPLPLDPRPDVLRVDPARRRACGAPVDRTGH